MENHHFSLVNPLWLYGHFQFRKLLVYQRVDIRWYGSWYQVQVAFIWISQAFQAAGNPPWAFGLEVRSIHFLWLLEGGSWPKGPKVRKTSSPSKSHQKWVVQTIFWLVYDCFIHIFLVGGLEHVLFVHLLGMCRMSSSQLTNSYLSEGWLNHQPALVHMAMDQYLLIAFLGGWTSIYQLFWASPGVQGFGTLPYEFLVILLVLGMAWRFPEGGYRRCLMGIFWLPHKTDMTFLHKSNVNGSENHGKPMTRILVVESTMMMMNDDDDEWWMMNDEWWMMMMMNDDDDDEWWWWMMMMNDDDDEWWWWMMMMMNDEWWWWWMMMMMMNDDADDDDEWWWWWMINDEWWMMNDEWWWWWRWRWRRRWRWRWRWWWWRWRWRRRRWRWRWRWWWLWWWWMMMMNDDDEWWWCWWWMVMMMMMNDDDDDDDDEWWWWMMMMVMMMMMMNDGDDEWWMMMMMNDDDEWWWWWMMMMMNDDDEWWWWWWWWWWMMNDDDEW